MGAMTKVSVVVSCSSVCRRLGSSGNSPVQKSVPVPPSRTRRKGERQCVLSHIYDSRHIDTLVRPVVACLVAARRAATMAFYSHRCIVWVLLLVTGEAGQLL